MTENKRFEYWEDSDTAYDTKIKYGQYFRIIDKKDMVCLLNEQEERIETLKEDVEIILDYVLNKGKFAMTVKEQKAHNRLRGFVRGDME